MPLTKTPLRYPGGKSQLRPLIRGIFESSTTEFRAYAEPFCGGAGIAMDLLLSDRIEHVWLNDLDPGIYSFWRAVVQENRRLTEWIGGVDISVSEWDRQRSVIAESSQDCGYDFELGAAYFYMSRTNRSGVIKGGMIGGRSQSGKYKLDCRFNKKNLIQLIQRIGDRGSCITVSNVDGAALIRTGFSRKLNPSQTMVFADPPYVNKSDGLYLNTFSPEDHSNLCAALRCSPMPYWLATYDDDPLIRTLYEDFGIHNLPIRYSASRRRVESELLMFSESLKLNLQSSPLVAS